MGGNCLKDCTTRRYNRAEYYALENEVMYKLDNLFPNDCKSPILSYHDKESFGDMDILISSEFMTQDMIEAIIDEFQPRQVFKNGNCLSFEYKEFQIDLIATGVANYESSQRYFAYNDLGNLCGRLAGAIGLKLGHDGLSYNYREGTNLIANIPISKHWYEILPILGLDYNPFFEGFNTLEEIFNFVASSTYFRKDIFLLENRNHTSRVRDSKRKTYMAFLEWLENGSCKHVEATETRSKEEWLHIHLESIKGFKEAYNASEKKHIDWVEYTSRFNGKIVNRITGLEGKELGMFMTFVKAHYHGAETLQRDVLKMNVKLVDSWIMHMYKLYSGTLEVTNLEFTIAQEK